MKELMSRQMLEVILSYLNLPDIFTGVGCLEGNYSIQVDDGFRPVVHPPRKVPVPLRDTLKSELDNMVKNGILAKVTEPTSWVSSLVIVKKPNGNI